MLVLSRKKDERIRIGDDITLTVVDVRGDKVRLGIEAPRDMSVDREEIRKRKDATRACERRHGDSQEVSDQSKKPVRTESGV